MTYFILDCCFTQFIIVPSSICIWRAIWNILDAFVFPHLHEWSDLVSLTAGFVGISVFFLLQYPTSFVSQRLDKYPWPKLVFEDVMFLMLTWLNLLLWRGGWNLCENHFLPDPHLGGWVSHCIGTVGLLSMQVFNNVGLHGIVRDGSYSNGEGFYPTQYLRILLGPDAVASVSV